MEIAPNAQRVIPPKILGRNTGTRARREQLKQECLRVLLHQRNNEYDDSQTISESGVWSGFSAMNVSQASRDKRSL
jgi:hypothetical protein